MSKREKWDTFGDRLRWARRKAGIDSPVVAAQQHGWNEHTYKSHEKGRRSPREREQTRTYARAYGVNYTWLLEGTGSPGSASRVPLFGSIGAGEEIEPVAQDNPDTIECPIPIDNGAAVVVRGESMQPAYRPGDTLFFSRKERADYEALHGRDCIVQLKDARVAMVKVLLRGTKRGLFRLRSYDTMKDIEDVEIDWAAPVEWVKRTGA